MNELIRYVKSVPLRLLVSAVVVAAIFAGCGDKATEPFRDGPRSEVVNNNPSDVIEFPDGFSNIATKCDHGNRVYSAYKGDQNRAAIAVVPNDESCNDVEVSSTTIYRP